MTRVEIGGGWDSAAAVVDDEWLERTARRPDVEPWLRTETALLPWLAPRLPLPVPVPHVVGEDPLVVRHRMLRGAPAPHPTAAHGHALGGFLRMLHAQDPDEAVALGVPGPERTRSMRATALRRFRTEVVPTLPAAIREAARALLDRLADAPVTSLVHGDLGPEHLLVDGERVSGVIDWSDARIADPAKDLAWALHGAPAEFADAVRVAYRPTAREVMRAADWRRIGPFYEVAFGLDTDDRTLVTSGRRGIEDELVTASDR